MRETTTPTGRYEIGSSRRAGCREPADQMAKTSEGSIVNVTFIMGFVGSTSGHPAYHASKGAVRIYSKAAAVRYGPSGVRVNSVDPGYMSPMLNATNPTSPIRPCVPQFSPGK